MPGLMLETYQAVGAGLSVVLDSFPEPSGVAGIEVHVVQHLQAGLVHWGVVPIQPTAQLEAWDQQQ